MTEQLFMLFEIHLQV